MKFLQLKSIITEIKSSVDGPNTSMEITEEGISELKYRMIEIMQSG